MERKHPTLWMLEYETETFTQLVMFYALDKQEAMNEVLKWSAERNVKLPPNPKLTHLPRGFQLNTRTLPGELQND
jgi:hypothetical protein